MSENRCHCKAARVLIVMTDRWGREQEYVSVCMCVCVCVCVCVCMCVHQSVRERDREANPAHDKNPHAIVKQSMRKSLITVL